MQGSHMFPGRVFPRQSLAVLAARQGTCYFSCWFHLSFSLQEMEGEKFQPISSTWWKCSLTVSWWWQSKYWSLAWVFPFPTHANCLLALKNWVGSSMLQRPLREQPPTSAHAWAAVGSPYLPFFHFSSWQCHLLKCGWVITTLLWPLSWLFQPETIPFSPVFPHIST